MTETSKKILEKYQVRKKRAQKTEFIEFMKGEFPEIEVEEGGFGKNRNLVIGNVSTAKAVLGAHYDTCAVLPFPNFIMPKNVLVSILYGVLIAVPMIIIAGFVSSLIGRHTDSFWLSEMVYFGFMFLFFYMLLGGKPNKHTVNDNTSGIITLIEIMSTMTPEERAEYAFVFFDNEENGLLGSAFFAKKHKEEMKEKLLINFDCVSDGDYMMIILNKKAQPEYEIAMNEAFEHIEDKTVLISGEKGTYYPSDQKNFRKNIGVAAFKKSRFGLYMDKIHTPKDTVMDERNIEMLAECIPDFLSKI